MNEGRNEVVALREKGKKERKEKKEGEKGKEGEKKEGGRKLGTERERLKD